MDKQLRAILDLLHQHHIAYWLDSGTLLGLQREGHLLASDKDLDLGVWDSELPKLQTLLAIFRQAGYQIYCASYKGQVFKYNLTPSNLKKHRTVDINIYREAHGHAWCPMYYFKLSPTTEKKVRPQKTVFTTIRGLLRSTWKTLNSKLTLTVKIDRLPWRPFLITGTWWIPSSYYKNTTHNSKLNATIPQEWESYLAFRYGNWRQPQTDWVFYRDDQGINPRTPAQLITKQ
ncbi:MAG: LicD family protein [Firmicutes bacterium]|nr:LicD family protein [Bacillota bacterium]